MSKKPFIPMIDKLNLTTFEREFFIDSLYEAPVLDLKTKVLELNLDLKRTLPFALYTQLNVKLSEKLNAKVHLNLHVEENDLDSKDNNAYIRLVLSHHYKDEFIKELLFTVEKNALIFIVESKDIEDILLMNLSDFQVELSQCGLVLKSMVKIREKAPAPIVEDVQVTIEKKKEPVSNTYKRKSMSDVSIFKISDLFEGQREVKIRGRIFNIETQMVKSNTVQRISFYVHDETDAITFTVFAEKDEERAKYASLSIGQHLLMFGDVKSDTKSELIFSIKKFEEIDDWMFVEDGADKKRVELHSHTKMSEMDGVADIESYLDKAFKWGHEAFAVTDHFTVQSFPKAQRKIKSLLKQYPNRRFKMIYGCEMSMSEDVLTAVNRPMAQNLMDSEYVLFDLETSGLSNQYDRIIEFGAVKVKQGLILERMQMFVKAPVKLSPFIIEKTNIKQSDIDNAQPEEVFIDQWLDFFKDAILVAHNANFDIGFINEALHRTNKPKLENTVIDTLALSKLLLDDKRTYKLGSIAKHYKITYDDITAHRADYDAEILKDVFAKLLEDAQTRLCLTTDDLNGLNKESSYTKAIGKHVILLAKNADGLKDLFRLVTIAHTERMSADAKNEESLVEPRLIRSDLDKYRENLLIGSACYSGEIFEIAMNRNQNELIDALKFYDYLEIQPLGNYQPMIENGVVPSLERLKTILLNLIDTAESLNIPVVATSDAHYLNPSDKIFRDIYINSKGTGKSRHPLYIYNPDRRQNSKSPDQYFRSTEDMLDQFSYLGASKAFELVVLNTNLIANRIEQVFPIKNELYTPSIEHAEENLQKIVYASANSKYGEQLPKIVADRLEKEITSINTHGFAVIYYIAHLLVKKSLDDGYIVGSRGSVGSSLVATLSNITEVNPLPPHYVCPKCHYSEFFTDGSVDSGYDLPDKSCPKCNEMMKQDGQDIPFETFLGFEGDKVPDIDLNFSSEYQEYAHAYTKVLFGAEHVFRAGTISTVAEKTAYGYVKGYMEEMNITTPYKNAYKAYLAKGCEGVKRTSGQHPGGIIVIPQDMDVHDFTPVNYPANKLNADWLTTHFEFGDIHDNVLKLDILGHVDPSAMKMLERITGIAVDTVPMNDEKTISLFNSNKALHAEDGYDEPTGAVGLPEFGTPFVRQILGSTKPSKFSDLVKISGLSHGTDVWLNNAKNLIESKVTTFDDVIGCRDDIMLYLIQKGLPSKAAFDIMEAIRKGKGLKDEQKTLLATHKVPQWYIDSCQRIKYLFPKAHAVAYVHMAVRVAWFKVHYPLHYYAVYFTLRCSAFEYETMTKPMRVVRSRLLNIQQRLNDINLKKEVSSKEVDLVSTLEAVYEMNSRGYKIAPLDLNLSHASDFIIHPEDPTALIPPFIILDGLGSNVAKSIVEQRQIKPFISKEDLQKRTQINTTQINRFEELGLLESLDDKNQMSFF